jgi:tRNA nucleotidyltransferase (CCA-adding enzyme)
MISLPDDVDRVLKTLTDAGYRAFVVGGSVRDMIMGRPINDWDFTTDAKPEQILALFPDSFYDNRFGTVGVKITDPKQLDENGKPVVLDVYEVTTFRSEHGYSDGRHPDSVEWGHTIEEDLSRRDFTVNAIAYDGHTLTDPFGGQEDIDKRIIRTVGDAASRFSEDALRMMRAVRLAAQLGFVIDGETLTAIAKTADNIRSVSGERVRDELLKLVASQFPADGVRLLKNSRLLSLILPELDACFGVQQKSPKRHHIYDVGTHSVLALSHCPSPDPIVRLATLLHDIGKPPTFARDEQGVITFYNHELVGAKLARGVAYRLRLSKKDTDLLITLIRWHQFSVDERQTDAAIRRIIRRVGRENMDAMLALRTGDRLGGGAQETSWRLELFKKRIVEVQKQPFSVRDLKVDGNDVMEVFETRPGKIVGDVLDALFAEVDQGTLTNDREQLLSKMRELRLSMGQPKEA